MGPQITSYLLANKRIEWNEFRSRVSQWEIDQLLPRL